MINRYTIILLITAPLLLSACVSSPKQGAVRDDLKPDWIVSPPHQSGSLYGVGAAEIYGNDAVAMSRAKEYGMADLIQQIEVNIGASSNSTQTMSSNSRGGSTFEQNVKQVVKTRVPELQFSFMSMEESFKDSANRQIYVLMHLDVNKEVQSLRKRIHEIDEALMSIDDQLSSPTTAKIEDLRKISSALVKFAQRASYQERLIKLQPNSSGAPLDDELRAVEDRLYARIGSLSVSIQPENQADRSISKSIEEQLTQRGLKIVTEGADLNIAYHIAVNVIERDGSYFGMTNGDVVVKDSTDNVIKTIKAKSKGSSSDKKLAERRATDKLGKAFGEAVIEALF